MPSSTNKLTIFATERFVKGTSELHRTAHFTLGSIRWPFPTSCASANWLYVRGTPANSACSSEWRDGASGAGRPRLGLALLLAQGRDQEGALRGSLPAIATADESRGAPDERESRWSNTDRQVERAQGEVALLHADSLVWFQ